MLMRDALKASPIQEQADVQAVLQGFTRTSFISMNLISFKGSPPLLYICLLHSGEGEKDSVLALFGDVVIGSIPASSGEHCHHQLLLTRHGSSFVSLLPVHPLSDKRELPAIPAVQFLDDVELECRLCFSNFGL